MITIKELYLKAKKEFDKAGLDSPAFNSLCLIEKVFNFNQAMIISGGDTAADSFKIYEFEKLVQRRLKGEPLQYLLGIWDFYGYKFKVGNGVLIPRDDTEVLLKDCLDFLKNKTKANVLDLCSGSGALAIAIAKETNSNVTAVEKSEKAVPYLQENVKLNNAQVKIIQGDIFKYTDEFKENNFDLILSNPPYIKSNDIKTLQKEISFEPVMALDGGKDGYNFYRHIIKHWSCKLKYGGMLAFELGEGQYNTVKQLMEQQGFKNIKGQQDLGDIQRTINGILI